VEALPTGTGINRACISVVAVFPLSRHAGPGCANVVHGAEIPIVAFAGFLGSVQATECSVTGINGARIAIIARERLTGAGQVLIA